MLENYILEAGWSILSYEADILYLTKTKFLPNISMCKVVWCAGHGTGELLAAQKERKRCLNCFIWTINLANEWLLMASLFAINPCYAALPGSSYFMSYVCSKMNSQKGIKMCNLDSGVSSLKTIQIMSRGMFATSTCSDPNRTSGTKKCSAALIQCHKTKSTAPAQFELKYCTWW